MRRAVLPLLLLAACRGPAPAERPVLLATTTSFQDTGLLDALLREFRAQGGPPVKPLAVGTGEALAMGRRGDADVLVVHAPDAEQAFMAEGHGTRRRALWHNDFVLLGPPSDPAAAGGMPRVAEALQRLASAQAPFASRGDGSGTHRKEQALRAAAGVAPWPGHFETGQGMAETLRIASERGAYVLSDRGTWRKLAPGLALRVVVENDPPLLNPYHVIEVDGQRHPGVNAQGARRFADFLVSARAREIVAGFGRETGGPPLFVPDTPGAAP